MTAPLDRSRWQAPFPHLTLLVKLAQTNPLKLDNISKIARFVSLLVALFLTFAQLWRGKFDLIFTFFQFTVVPPRQRIRVSRYIALASTNDLRPFFPSVSVAILLLHNSLRSKCTFLGFESSIIAKEVTRTFELLACERMPNCVILHGIQGVSNP